MYGRRFALVHTGRVVKHVLDWTTPCVRHTEQTGRWTWLVVIASTRLRLARPAIRAQRLPWERPLALTVLTPYRMRRAVSRVPAVLGIPASPSQPRGRPPSRPKGRRSSPVPRYPGLKQPPEPTLAGILSAT